MESPPPRQGGDRGFEARQVRLPTPQQSRPVKADAVLELSDAPDGHAAGDLPGDEAADEASGEEDGPHVIKRNLAEIILTRVNTVG
jgi:hypothetical protein